MAEPLRVGILDDIAAGPPSDASTRWLRFAADELIAAGRLDRAVEFVTAQGTGLPSGTAAVERAFASLVEQDVLMIVGPAIGDNALVATPLADRHAIPTINWAGAERARGDFMFHLQVGSHEDESILLARHLAALGAGRAAVIYDRSPIGRRHLDYLRAEAEIVGLRLATAVPIAPLADDAAGAEVAEIADDRVDAVVYLGLGLAAPAVARGLASRGWTGTACMNTAGIRGYDPRFAKAIDGWTYVDMHADGNLTLGALRRRADAPAEPAFRVAQGYDLGRLVAEGLARAPERTRRGVREGLESVKWLAAAEGQEGTLLGFGVHDRGALHGRYLVLRRWEDGRSVEVTPA